MRQRPTGAAPTLRAWALALLLAHPARPAFAEPACKIGRLAELPVTMSGTTPIVHALINGQDAAFVADSGAFSNMLTPAAATKYQLKLKMAPFGMYVSGVGGQASPDMTTVKEFTIFGVKIPNVPFVVVGNDLGPAVGLLGQNVFRIADTEYDLANGVIRIMRPGPECKSIGLAYWAAGSPFSQIDLERGSPERPHILGYAYVNGIKIKVMFDTGADTSVLSLAGAKRAGITPGSAGVVPAGVGEGLGQHYVQSWIAPLRSFKIGDEEIRDTKVHIGDIGTSPLGEEMLLGADFFLSHRIYDANSRDKLYFTYNGGPVFNVGVGEAAQSKNESIVVASGQSIASSVEPTDAEAFSRRATASAARQNYSSAVADLNRAVERAPTEARYRYQRGMALWENGQSELALADFNEALRLKPDYVPALLARAHFRADSDPAAATADLQAADRTLPKEDPGHLEIGNAYEEADLLPAALIQYSKWIDSHERTDVRMPEALNSRCWTRALLNQELEAALADCNAAVKLQPKSAAYLDSRALVFLRQGKYDTAIADYDAALAISPKTSSARYCRGIARSRQGHATEGQADIAEATAQSPKVAEFYTHHGIIP